MVRIMTAIIATHRPATKRKLELTMPVATSATAIAIIGMQQTIIQP